jgi:DNA-binding FadR family transcriptional regulator
MIITCNGEPACRGEEAAVTIAEGIIRVPKAAELVASTLRRQIVTGELKEDDSLPSEALLMQRFRVSRPTLREAFRILESESLIQVRRGARGGARVQIPDGDVAARYAGYVLEYRGTTMADVYTARAELEVPLARLLATTAKPKQVARLRTVIDEAADHLDDAEAYSEYDVQFHLLVAELAGNQTLEAWTGPRTCRSSTRSTARTPSSWSSSPPATPTPPRRCGASTCSRWPSTTTHGRSPRPSWR